MAPPLPPDASRTRRRRMGPRTRIAAVVVILGLSYLALGLRSRGRGQILDAFPEVTTYYPCGSDDEVAREVTAIAARLGVDLWSHREGHTPPPPEATRRLELAAKELGGYVGGQVASAVDAIDAPPQLLMEHLAAHEGDLRRLEEILQEGELPAWESLIDDGRPMVQVGALAHLTLGRLLTARALDHLRAGRDADADRTCRAALRLARAIGRRPEVFASVVSLIGLRSQLALMRKMRSPDVSWRREIEGLDARENVLRSLRASVWDEAQELRRGTFAQGTPAALIVPRLDLERLLPVLPLAYAELAAAPVEGFDAAAFEARWAARVGGVLPYAGGRFQHAAEQYWRALHLMMETELTQLVMELRSTTRRGRYDVPSRACPGRSFRVAVDEAGGTVDFEMPLPPAGRSTLPLMHCLGPAPGLELPEGGVVQ